MRDLVGKSAGEEHMARIQRAEVQAETGRRGDAAQVHMEEKAFTLDTLEAEACVAGQSVLPRAL